MKYEKLRVTVLEAIQDAVSMGLIVGTSGNIALRDDEDDVVAITPSGVPYKGMKPEDIAIVDLDGNWIDGNYKPSSELPMHLPVMKHRKDARATVHTHSIYATLMAMGKDPKLDSITPPHCEYTPVGIVPFTMPGSLEVAERMVDAIGDDKSVALIKNHGTFALGKDMAAAMMATSYLEEMAIANFYGQMRADYEPMPEESVKELQAMIAQDKAV